MYNSDGFGLADINLLFSVCFQAEHRTNLAICTGSFLSFSVRTGKLCWLSGVRNSDFTLQTQFQTQFPMLNASRLKIDFRIEKQTDQKKMVGFTGQCWQVKPIHDECLTFAKMKNKEITLRRESENHITLTSGGALF